MTKDDAEIFLDQLEAYFRYELEDECGADGVYLSDGVYVDALDYAIMQGMLSKKQERLFNKAINILYPDGEEDDA